MEASRSRLFENLAANFIEVRGKRLDRILRVVPEPAPPESSPEVVVKAHRGHWPKPPHVRPVGRNSPCPCGSGKKFKRCHLSKN